MRASCLGVALLLLVPVSAAAQQRTDCAPQIRAQVENEVARYVSAASLDELSCVGLVEVYFVLDDPHQDVLKKRRQVRAVFRGEGLIR